MLTVYHARRTRSVRIVWLLEEMGVPYEVRSVPLRDLPPEVIAHNPAGTLPVMVDGDVVLSESVTMLDYVAETYGPTPLAVQPGEANYWDYRQLMMFGEATLAAPINGVVANVFMAPDDQKNDFTCGVIRSSFQKRLKVVSQRLARCDYVAGDAFTLADISVGYGINLAVTAPVLGLADLITPDLVAYEARLAARPAFQRMIKVK